MDKEFYTKSLDETGMRLIGMGQDLIRQGRELLSKSRYITITVISRWYNEEILAPFFLDHYSYADKIVILLSADTNDRTEEILRRSDKVVIRKFKYKDKFGCRETTDRIIEAYKEECSDWVILPDADEFVFPKGMADVREVLRSADGDIVYADEWQIYRHKDEMDLDPTLKAVWLRRHGDPNREKGENARYCKPIIVRSGLDIKWSIGLHFFEEDPGLKVSLTRFDGVHWVMADPDLAVKRRMRGRKENVCEEDIEKGWCDNNFEVTEKQIRDECKAHENDPQLF